MTRTYIVGVGAHRFGNGVAPEVMAHSAVATALDDAGLEVRDIGAFSFGTVDDDPGAVGRAVLTGLGPTSAPVAFVQNASATGAVAFREAILAVESGRCRVAAAIGFQGGGGHGRPSPSAPFARLLARPGAEGSILPAAHFGMLAVRRMHDVGTTVETYAAIAAKNWNQARSNPIALRRAVRDVTVEQVLASRAIAYPHTSMMCAGVCGGAVCVIVADRHTATSAAERSGGPMVRIGAAEVQSEHVTGAHGEPPGLRDLTLATTAATAASAYATADVAPGDLDVVQVHDAFPVEELIYAELLGICAVGEADRLVADGATRLGGRIPFSTDGGLIGRGHPVGAGGLAQLHELTIQLRGAAGIRQVQGARVGLAHIIGRGALCAVTILVRERVAPAAALTGSLHDRSIE